MFFTHRYAEIIRILLLLRQRRHVDAHHPMLSTCRSQTLCAQSFTVKIPVPPAKDGDVAGKLKGYAKAMCSDLNHPLVRLLSLSFGRRSFQQMLVSATAKMSA
jgi:hypothetical protein